jgi:hypothetical protein
MFEVGAGPWIWLHLTRWEVVIIMTAPWTSSMCATMGCWCAIVSGLDRSVTFRFATRVAPSMSNATICSVCGLPPFGLGRTCAHYTILLMRAPIPAVMSRAQSCFSVHCWQHRTSDSIGSDKFALWRVSVCSTKPIRFWMYAPCLASNEGALYASTVLYTILSKPPLMRSPCDFYTTYSRLIEKYTFK